MNNETELLLQGLVDPVLLWARVYRSCRLGLGKRVDACGWAGCLCFFEHLAELLIGLAQVGGVVPNGYGYGCVNMWHKELQPGGSACNEDEHTSGTLHFLDSKGFTMLVERS